MRCHGGMKLLKWPPAALPHQDRVCKFPWSFMEVFFCLFFFPSWGKETLLGPDPTAELLGSREPA